MAGLVKHWRYGKYVLRHKWFVFRAGLRRGVPIGRLIVHDLSKFRPDEWGPYAEWFYGASPAGHPWRDVLKRAKEVRAARMPNIDESVLFAQAERLYEAFMEAFLRHLHRNDHHWQYYVLTPDAQDRPTQVFPMPRPALLEMLADWDGAGQAITGKVDTLGWYTRQGPKEKLHPKTRIEVERLLGYVDRPAA